MIGCSICLLGRDVCLIGRGIRRGEGVTDVYNFSGHYVPPQLLLLLYMFLLHIFSR